MISKEIHSQMVKTYNAFYSDTPKTMLQVSLETGILRANICRYVSIFRKTERITLIKKGICSISKHRAGFYSTKVEVYDE